MDLVDTPSPEGQAEERDIAPFPLDQLPLEIIHHLVRCVDERPQSSHFPSGPSIELLALSQTSVFFYNHCRPLVWRSIAFEAEAGAPRPPAWVAKRSLKAFVLVMKESRVVGADPRPGHDDGKLPSGGTRSKDRPHSPLPVKAFSWSLSTAQLASGSDEDDTRVELEALVDVLILLKASKVQVLFLRGAEEAPIPKKLSTALIKAVLDLDALSALRLNQVYMRGDMTWLAEEKQLPRLRTLQIMHGHKRLVDFTRLAPNLESLLLWTHSRRFTGKGLDKIIVDKLPTLRLLSLDAVHDAELIALVAKTITSLAASNITVPLEELFLEGRQTISARSELLRALALVPTLRRLALYHLRDAKPTLLYEIHDVAPQLEALTLVHGDTSRPVEWPAPLADYAHALARFPNLSFFAWDRMSPVDALTNGMPKKQLEREYDALSRLGMMVPSLTEVVAITEDVSEGSWGYFAGFTRQGSAVRVNVRKHRATDFLVGFERWCVIADD